MSHTHILHSTHTTF